MKSFKQTTRIAKKPREHKYVVKFTPRTEEGYSQGSLQIDHPHNTVGNCIHSIHRLNDGKRCYVADIQNNKVTTLTEDQQNTLNSAMNRVFNSECEKVEAWAGMKPVATSVNRIAHSGEAAIRHGYGREYT